jgi:hypothetical protein
VLIAPSIGKEHHLTARTERPSLIPIPGGPIERGSFGTANLPGKDILRAIVFTGKNHGAVVRADPRRILGILGTEGGTNLVGGAIMEIDIPTS